VRPLAALLFILALVPAAVLAKPIQISMGGIVTTDAPGPKAMQTYTPVIGVEVFIDKLHRCQTDDKGFFHLDNLPKAIYSVTFSKAGYANVTQSVSVDNQGIPANIRVVMNPADYHATAGGTPTGPGTVVVAFAELKGESPVGNNRNFETKLLYRDPNWIGAHCDFVPDFNNGEQNNINVEPNTLMIYPPAARARTGYVDLAFQPYWVCFDSQGHTLYVAGSNKMVSLYDPAHASEPLRVLPAEGVVNDLVLSSTGKYVLVAVMNPGRNKIMVIDTASQLELNSLACATTPRSVTMIGERVYALESEGAIEQIEVFNHSDGRVVQRFKVVGGGLDVARSPDGKFLFVANSGAASVSVLESQTGQLVIRIPVQATPTRLAVSPNGQRLFVTNKTSDTVSVIDLNTRTVIASARPGKSPIGLAFNHDGSRVYVACNDSGTVVTLDGQTGRVLDSSLPLPHSSPFGVAVQP
jgi:YVTN family beta-propeller protein